LSATDIPNQAETATSIITETAAALGGTSGYSQAVRDALTDYNVAIGDALAVGDQASSDLAELAAKKDLIPAHGFERLHGEVVADAAKLSDAALRRAETAEARLMEALTVDALPKLDPNRESLAREELRAAFDGADGKTVFSRLTNIAQNGSREVVAVLFTGYGQTLLASKGANAREIAEALSTARVIAARMAPELGETDRQKMAGAALLKVGKLGGARTAARLYVRGIVG